ncbi:MAG: hypothetical protein HQ519_07940, partial [Planctomycetes bacterium]|nr:hypothetical protein [Planctomycetota bacterium]
MKAKTEVCRDDDGAYLKVKLSFREPKAALVVQDPKPVECVAEPVPVEPTPPAKTPASRVARRLALAYAIERFIDSGAVENFAQASRRFGISRPRVTQIMSLIHLAAPVQEAILSGTLVDSERKVLAANRDPDWTA